MSTDNQQITELQAIIKQQREFIDILLAERRIQSPTPTVVPCPTYPSLQGPWYDPTHIWCHVSSGNGV